MKSGIAPSLEKAELEKINFLDTQPPVVPTFSANEVAQPTAPPPENIILPAQEEAIVLLEGRPVLLIRRNRIQPPTSGIWVEPILSKRSLIESLLPSIGRIEVDQGNGSRHMGTGWVIADNIIATNRHVAETFAIKKGEGGVFKINFLQMEYRANIDFIEEYQERAEFEIPVEEVVFMQEPDRRMPDIAFLKINNHVQLPPPLPIFDGDISYEDNIAIVGYPAFDPRYGLDAIEAAKAIFGNIYDVKRFSPGKYKGAVNGHWYFMHDATTLGGNSGSPVIHLETGSVIGMHFSGEFRSMNYAVKISEIVKQAQESGIRLKAVKSTKYSQPEPASPDETVEEAPSAESLKDRKGFLSNFLGAENKVSLPKLSSNLKNDLLKFTDSREQEQSILKYTHFSLEMNKARRLCFYSAVNIEGNSSISIKGKRPGWKTDPRIPDEFQVIKECYGREQDGKFSRGHMTRREDPNWGGIEIATIANGDTFYVTNACPQIQPFNAGIWNGLEDYALENARQDDMKISVITGPVFKDDDPVFFNVKVPVSFWKVIAFIHDKTEELTATGYLMSQRDFLPGEEFVFGQYETNQVSLKEIEALTGLSFGTLKSKEPKMIAEESTMSSIRSFDQIRFV